VSSKLIFLSSLFLINFYPPFLRLYVFLCIDLAIYKKNNTTNLKSFKTLKFKARECKYVLLNIRLDPSSHSLFFQNLMALCCFYQWFLRKDWNFFCFGDVKIELLVLNSTEFVYFCECVLILSQLWPFLQSASHWPNELHVGFRVCNEGITFSLLSAV
jgi:hypothetical protein